MSLQGSTPESQQFEHCVKCFTIAVCKERGECLTGGKMPADKRDRLLVADEIERCVEDGHHKRYGTSDAQSELSAGNDWWRKIVKYLREEALPSETRLTTPVRQVDKQVTLQASEYAQLVFDARRYDWLAHNMRVLRAGSDGARHFIDVPSAMSFQEAVDKAMAQEKPNG